MRSPATQARKAEQLGMNPGTARNRLVTDLLFDFAVRAGHKCCRCGHDLDRETFSVDHLTPWLDSADPKSLFFDLKNIGFSHLACNIGDARRPNFKTEAEVAALPCKHRTKLLKGRRKAARKRLRTALEAR